jgi:hypothetical protein
MAFLCKTYAQSQQNTDVGIANSIEFALIGRSPPSATFLVAFFYPEPGQKNAR